MSPTYIVIMIIQWEKKHYGWFVLNSQQIIHGAYDMNFSSFPVIHNDDVVIFVLLRREEKNNFSNKMTSIGD